MAYKNVIIAEENLELVKENRRLQDMARNLGLPQIPQGPSAAQEVPRETELAEPGEGENFAPEWLMQSEGLNNSVDTTFRAMCACQCRTS